MAFSPHMSMLRRGLALCFFACWPFVSTAANAEPIAIRMGVGTSSEEQAWLMKARPDLTPHQGKDYIYDMSVFRSGGDRLTAMEAGQLDAVTTSTTGALFGASKGLQVVIVAAMARESTKTFSTGYYALASSDTTLQTLKGKTFGVNGYRSSLELYARLGIKKAGLSADRDVKWLVVPLPQMADALRRGKIDVGVLPSTFAFVATRAGDMRKLFDSAGISGIEEEFDIAFSRKFVESHPEVIRAWAQDFVDVTRYWNEHNDDARKGLVASGLVQTPPDVYLAMQAKDDLLRTTDVVKPDAAMMEKLQNELVNSGFQDGEADISKLVNTSFLP